MPTIYTIGFTQKSLRTFIALLRQAEVDAVIDIRLRNTGQLAGWAKRDDLAYILELVHIGYEHQPELAPTDEILDGYRKDHDWEGYIGKFQPLIARRNIQTIGEAILRRHRAPCLLCSEATADHCHRRLVAEYWAEQIGGLAIVHL
jgi:uncharacterized protein (DUF488 family)